jgi:hypothetical protein
LLTPRACAIASLMVRCATPDVGHPLHCMATPSCAPYIALVAMVDGRARENQENPAVIGDRLLPISLLSSNWPHQMHHLPYLDILSVHPTENLNFSSRDCSREAPLSRMLSAFWYERDHDPASSSLDVRIMCTRGSRFDDRAPLPEDAECSADEISAHLARFASAD